MGALTTFRRLLWLGIAGIPITVGRRFGRWVYSTREYNVLEYDFSGATNVGATTGDVKVQVLDAPTDALREFCRARYGAWHRDEQSAERSTMRRFARGELCFAALDRGRMTTHVWSSEVSLQEPELEHAKSLRSDEVVLYDIYTLPEFRGRRHYDMVFHHFAAWFERAGKTRLVMVVDADNLPSLRANARVGIGRVSYRLRLRRLLGRAHLSPLPAPVALADLIPPRHVTNRAHGHVSQG